jgi:hypothetical protein
MRIFLITENNEVLGTRPGRLPRKLKKRLKKAGCHTPNLFTGIDIGRFYEKDHKTYDIIMPGAFRLSLLERPVQSILLSHDANSTLRKLPPIRPFLHP